MQIFPLIIVAAAYLIINAAVIVLYAYDKRKAVKGEWRVKESTLILASLFGPFGAVAGMQWARHKTRKLKFKIVYAFLVLHILIIIFLIWYFGFN